MLGCGALCVLLAAMVLTQSRGPALSMVLVIFVSLAAMGYWKIALLLPLPAALYAVLLLNGAIDPGQWVARGSTHRFDIWLQSWDLVRESAKSLIIGQGIATDYAFQLVNGSSVKSPHNLFLANQLYGGVIATLLFFSLLLVTTVRAVRGFLQSGNFVICALLLFGLGVGLFDYRTVLINLSQEWMSFWLPVLLTAAGWPGSDGRHPSQA